MRQKCHQGGYMRIACNQCNNQRSPRRCCSRWLPQQVVCMFHSLVPHNMVVLMHTWDLGLRRVSIPYRISTSGAKRGMEQECV
eukprot:213604-Chlamydomonas_euryale.AAC.3